MIASRRKEQNADRSVAKNRVRREAIMDAKRGRTPAPNAPSAKKQIEEHVEEAQVKRARQRRRQNNTKPHPKNDLKTKQATRKDRNTDSKTIQKATKTAKAIANAPPVTVKPPSRKAVVAAVNAMEAKGYQIPEGMKMVISFAPKGENPTKPAATPSMGTSTRIQQQGGGRGDSGRGGPGRGGRRGGRSGGRS